MVDSRSVHIIRTKIHQAAVSDLQDSGIPLSFCYVVNEV